MSSKYVHPKPSVFTPFFRRFTDERARDLKDTIALYNEVRSQYLASKWSDNEAQIRLHGDIWGTLFYYRDEQLPACSVYNQAVSACINRLLSLEKPIFETAEPDLGFHVLTLKEQVDLRRFLRAQQYFLAHEERVVEELTHILVVLFDGITNELPPLSEESLLTIPLIYIHPEPASVVDKVIGTFEGKTSADLGLFAALNTHFYENACAFNGFIPYEEHKKPFKTIVGLDIPPLDILDAYLKNTPLYDFFLAPVPLPLSQETRHSHHWIVAGSGHGKTQTLQYLLTEDLKQVEEGKASLVVLDSQGDLIRTISHLRGFTYGQPLHGKLCLIDPTDIEYPVSLNLFDVGMERINQYSPLDRERLVNSVLELYDFVLGSLLSAELTQKQAVIFRYITRLMLHIPNATIHTFRELMEPDGYEKYREHISKLKGTARAFFETEFNSKQFEDTKRQVVRRLWGILENQTFERMFSHPKSKLDLYSEMNAGKVILINTAKDLLKQTGTEIFGRFFIAMIGQAVQERATIPADKRMATYLYVDECQDYLIGGDKTISTILEQARKYKLGTIWAHQYLAQLDPKMQQCFSANTAIKFAGGVSDKDARSFAGMLRCKPDFIEAQKTGSFAAFIRNVTDTAIPLSFPFGVMEEKERMTTEEWHAVRGDMRRKYATHHSEVEQHISKGLSEEAGQPFTDPDETETDPSHW